MWASTCLLPELKIALSNAQMILDPFDKHWTRGVPGPGGAAGLWEKQEVKVLALLHSPFKHDQFFEVAVHWLKGFYLLPCQRNSTFTTLPGKFLHMRLSSFGVLVNSCNFPNWNAFSLLCLNLTIGSSCKPSQLQGNCVFLFPVPVTFIGHLLVWNWSIVFPVLSVVFPAVRILNPSKDTLSYRSGAISHTSWIPSLLLSDSPYIMLNCTSF